MVYSIALRKEYSWVDEVFKGGPTYSQVNRTFDRILCEVIYGKVNVKCLEYFLKVHNLVF